MKSEFMVDLDRLDRLVTRLAELSVYITEQLDLIDDKVEGLDGVWESVAAAAYRDAHQLWAIGAREFATGMSAMSDSARTAHDRYTRAIELNRTMLSDG